MIVYVIDKDIYEKLEIRNPVDNYDVAEEMLKNDLNVIYRNGRYEMYNRTYEWYELFAKFAQIIFEVDDYIQENFIGINIFLETEIPVSSSRYDLFYIQKSKAIIKEMLHYESYFQDINMPKMINYIDNMFLPITKIVKDITIELFNKYN